MPTTSRPKTEDKFSKARSAKNSPERQAAAGKKRAIPCGPSSVKPKSAKERNDRESQQPDLSKKELVVRRDATPKMRDEERVFNLVHAILSAWKAEQGHAENTAASSGIIKVSRRKIEGALRDLKNTRFTKIPSLINDVLVYNEIFNEFGQWVYVEHDAPDWIFVRLPENSTPVIRAQISDTSLDVTVTSEALLDSYCEEAIADKGPDMDAIRKTLVARSNYTAEYVARMSDKDVLAMNAFYAL